MVDKILENIAVLLLEIIGYISSPIYFFLIACLIFPELFSIVVKISDIDAFVAVIGIYSLGYLFRSTSMTVGDLGPLAIESSIIEEIERTETFNKVKNEFSKRISISSDKLSFKDIRNMELSKHPEIADKAYLFMFRANLFLDILVINFLFIAIIIFYWLLKYCFGISFQYNLEFINSLLILMIALLISRPLWKARRLFFKMSYSIPITHYLGKEKI